MYSGIAGDVKDHTIRRKEKITYVEIVVTENVA